MLALDFGDTIWLRLHGDPRYALYSNTGHYTTFSGYLVYPDTYDYQSQRHRQHSAYNSQQAPLQEHTAPPRDKTAAERDVVGLTEQKRQRGEEEEEEQEQERVKEEADQVEDVEEEDEEEEDEEEG